MEKRCGTCRWWKGYNDEPYLWGRCKWDEGNLPISFPETDLRIKRESGYNCPCWQPRERK